MRFSLLNISFIALDVSFITACKPSILDIFHPSPCTGDDGWRWCEPGWLGGIHKWWGTSQNVRAYSHYICRTSEWLLHVWLFFPKEFGFMLSLASIRESGKVQRVDRRMDQVELLHSLRNYSLHPICCSQIILCLKQAAMLLYFCLSSICICSICSNCN